MFQRRMALVLVLVVGVFLILELKIFSLQILSGSYYQLEAQKRSTRIEMLHALRGKILDRTGQVLAEDSPAFDLYLTPAYVAKDQKMFKLLAVLLKTTPAELEKRLNDINNRIETRFQDKPERERKGLLREARFTSYNFWANIPVDTAVEIVANQKQYPGLFVQEKDRRNYLYGALACHITGYLGPVTAEEYDSFKDNNYFRNHLNPAVDDITYAVLENKGEFMTQPLGRFGVEKQCDEELTGTNGVRMVEVDFTTHTERELSRLPPTDGNNVTLTIDLALQQKVESLLAGKTGSVVVMDVRTGEVLALASSPSFNPTAMQSPVAAATVQYLFHSPAKPLYNRAISGEYAPGSLFKIVTATAGLESKSINRNTEFNCTGYFSPNMKHFKCWTAEYNRGHGLMNIVTGLQHSCNVFFFNTGKLAGPENILGWAAKYGLGARTGIDLSGENTGYLPSEEDQLKRHKQPWHLSDTLNISIGQGDLMLTPLQVVRMMACVANGGTLVTPHVIKEEKNLAPPVTVPIGKETLTLIRQGLYNVVHSEGGTAHGLGLEAFDMAGKTSTAQVGETNTHAWFVGFAPSANPRIVVVVMIEHGGKGSEAAAPIAAGFMETALQVK